MRPTKKLLRGIAILAIAALAFAYQLQTADSPAGSGADDADKIAQAYEAQRSDLWVESGGVVERKLKDDREGSMHQRFIVRLSNGHTILIAHNIDLASRVPIEVGDSVRFRGEFEWNPRGGVVHWTHHDPQGRKPGGWIRHGSATYE